MGSENAIFVDVQYCIYDDIVGGSEKSKISSRNIEMVPKVKTSGAEVKEVNKRQRQFDENFFFEMRNHPLSRLLNAYYMGRKFKPCVGMFLDFIMGRIPGQTQCFGFCTKPFDGIFSA